MKSKLFIMLRENSFICRKPNECNTYECKFDIENLPNIPFYYHVWDDPDKYKSIFNNFCKKYSLVGRIMKPNITIAKPEDSIKVDISAIIEFFYFCGARNIIFLNECMLLSAKTHYISIIETCRMTVIRYIKANTVISNLYLENKAYTDDELLVFIKDMHTDCSREDIPVFLNGKNLERYSSIGTYVTLQEMLNNYNIKYSGECI